MTQTINPHVARLVDILTALAVKSAREGATLGDTAPLTDVLAVHVEEAMRDLAMAFPDVGRAFVENARGKS